MSALIFQPYLVSIIVIYPEFEKQMVERGTRARNWRSIGMFAARVAFWWLVAEAALHFLYFEAILADAKFAAQLPKNEFVTLGMALGRLIGGMRRQISCAFQVPSST